MPALSSSKGSTKGTSEASILLDALLVWEDELALLPSRMGPPRSGPELDPLQADNSHNNTHPSAFVLRDVCVLIIEINCVRIAGRKYALSGVFSEL